MIPGLEHAEFLRYGLMHRNSYINAPKALNEDLSLKNASNVYIAGQLSDVEGYVESAATGIIAAINLWRKEEGKEFVQAPRCSVIGSLLDYILHAASSKFEPMNANWALLPFVNKNERLPAVEESLKIMDEFLRAIDE